jgi:hypothetical protein
MTVVQDVDTVVEQVQDVTPAVYDPAKKYSWGIETEFTLNGQEFGLILNTLRAIVNTEEAVKILMADKSNQILEGTMAKAVAEGKIFEAE